MLDSFYRENAENLTYSPAKIGKATVQQCKVLLLRYQKEFCSPHMRLLRHLAVEY